MLELLFFIIAAWLYFPFKVYFICFRSLIITFFALLPFILRTFCITIIRRLTYSKASHFEKLFHYNSYSLFILVQLYTLLTSTELCITRSVMTLIVEVWCTLKEKLLFIHEICLVSTHSVLLEGFCTLLNIVNFIRLSVSFATITTWCSTWLYSNIEFNRDDKLQCGFR